MSKTQTVDDPERLADECYGERHDLATTHGRVALDRVQVKEVVNAFHEEIRETFWRADCPNCGRTHTSDGPSEDARSAWLDDLLDCCDAVEWLAPADFVEDCAVCGDSHREKDGCTRLDLRAAAYRPDSLDDTFRCVDCEWTGDGEDLTAEYGCPDCESTSVTVVADD